MQPFARQRILQIHPSLRCNLQCGHCYSESGPGVAQVLEVDLASEAISDAARIGYQVLSVSGGEPLLYPELPDLLRIARGAGMATTMTTNGMLLGQHLAKFVLDELDGVAISLDGPPEVHDHVRGRAGAFKAIPRAAALLRERGLRFGFITTLTDRNWMHLPWLAEFAAEQGAVLLQIHPLEMIGRAVAEMRDEAPQQLAFGRAFLMVIALREKYRNRLTIGLDLQLRDEMVRDPEIVYAGDPIATGNDADELGLLILEADGTLVPISYGFSRGYALGNVHERSLVNAFAAWRNEGKEDFRRLCSWVLHEIAANPDEQLVNWHERVVSRSHHAGPFAPDVSGDRAISYA
jgi:Fe-coproporphyrin III synthase